MIGASPQPIGAPLRPGFMHLISRRLAAVLLGAAFAAALAASASSGVAYACSCAASAPLDLLNRAEVVFEGTVTSVAIPPSVPGRDTSQDPLAVSFRVETIVKWTPGGPASAVTVSTPNNSAACGVAFSRGERWRVYASRPDPAAGGNLETNLCSGDELLSAAPPAAGDGPPLPGLLVAAIAVAGTAIWIGLRRPGAPAS